LDDDLVDTSYSSEEDNEIEGQGDDEKDVMSTTATMVNNDSIVQSMFRSGRVLMALGTLMYAPVDRFQDAWITSKNTKKKKQEYQMERSTFQKCIKGWPTLTDVIFHNGGGTHNLLSSYDEDEDEDESTNHTQRDDTMVIPTIARGDVRTYKGDETLFGLLSDCVNFSIDSIYGPKLYREPLEYQTHQANIKNKQLPKYNNNKLN
jgi:hypothetical protein